MLNVENKLLEIYRRKSRETSTFYRVFVLSKVQMHVVKNGNGFKRSSHVLNHSLDMEIAFIHILR